MLTSLIALPFAFWLLLVFFLAVEFLFMAYDSGWGVGATTFAFFFVLAFTGTFNVAIWAYHHPGSAIVGAAVYVLIGLGWSFAKWLLYNKQREAAVAEFRSDYLSKYTPPTLENTVLTDREKVREEIVNPGNALASGFRNAEYRDVPLDAEELVRAKEANLKDRKEQYRLSYESSLTSQGLREVGPDGKYTERPWFKNHKSRITTWAAYWPISFAWTFLEDFVVNLFKNLVQTFSSLYQGISNRVFKNADQPIV